MQGGWRKKWSGIALFLEANPQTVLALQETKCGSANFNCRTHHSEALKHNNRSSGVMIFWPRGMGGSVKPELSIADAGRMMMITVITDVLHAGKRVAFTSLYIPPNIVDWEAKEALACIDRITPAMKDYVWFVGGDFNDPSLIPTLAQSEDGTYSERKTAPGAQKVNAELVDVMTKHGMHVINDTDGRGTHRKGGTLDLIMTNSASNIVTVFETCYDSKHLCDSDHFPIKCSIEMSSNKQVAPDDSLGWDLSQADWDLFKKEASARYDQCKKVQPPNQYDYQARVDWLNERITTAIGRVGWEEKTQQKIPSVDHHRVQDSPLQL